MTEGLDIQAQTVALAEMTGVKRETVAEMVLRPHELVVTRYLEDENGSKYVVLDKANSQYGEAARETLTFKVSKA